MCFISAAVFASASCFVELVDPNQSVQYVGHDTHVMNKCG